MLVALMVALALLAAPALAGNTVTITGEVLVAVPPIADFSADPTSGTAPLAVQFSDLSTGAINSWAWDFDNDGTVDSTDQNPVFTYSSAGTYTVKLTVTGPAGSDSLVKTDCITVNAPVRRPIALFTQDAYAGTAPLTVKFTDRSLFNPTQYLWRFGDGATSTEKSPQHTYTSRGVYPVRLDVSNAAGSSTAWSVVVVLRYSWW
jgi:PKD repeat protein